MKINIYVIFLTILYLITSSFFGLVSLSLPKQDLILVISLIVIVFYSKELKKGFIEEDRYFYYFFFYSFFATLFMAYLNFGQPIVFSMRVARLFIIYSILILALNILLKNLKINKLYLFVTIISFIIIFINFYVYITGDISILTEDAKVLERLGQIRIVIGTFSIIIIILFLYHHLKENKWFIVPLLGLLLTIIVVHKTRSALFPLLIIMILPLLRVYKAQFIKFWMLFGAIVLVSFMVSGYEKSILSPITDLVMLLIDESQTVKHSNVNIRGLELAYFWNFLDTKSIIFGYGMNNIQFKVLYISHFYLSDIGLFKIFYLHGIIGSLLYIAMLWRLYRISKQSNSSIHLTGRSIVYFQILSPSSIFVYTPEYMFLLFVIYILVKNSNKQIQSSSKIKEKEYE